MELEFDVLLGWPTFKMLSFFNGLRGQVTLDKYSKFKLSELQSFDLLTRFESLGDLLTAGLTDCSDLQSKEEELSLSEQHRTTFASFILRTLNLLGDAKALNSKPPAS